MTEQLFTEDEITRLVRNLEETSYNEGSADLACRCADALVVIKQLQAARASQPAPEGFVCVPEYPTQVMRDAGNRKLAQLKTEPGMITADRAFYVYSAMLSAAPTAGNGGEG